jgi:hypothetical protein
VPKPLRRFYFNGSENAVGKQHPFALLFDLSQGGALTRLAFDHQ